MMQPFDMKIQSVIRKFWYPVWFVIKHNDTDCPCVDFTTHQPDPFCKKCLGTGKEIHIVKIRAAHHNDDVSLSGNGLGNSEKNVTATFYTLNDVKATEADLIIDGNEVDVIQRAYAERSNDTEPVYYKYVAIPMKSNYAMFLKNFRGVLSDAGKKQ